MTAEQTNSLITRNMKILPGLVSKWVGLNKEHLFDEKAVLMDPTGFPDYIRESVESVQKEIGACLKGRKYHSAIGLATCYLENMEVESLGKLAGVVKSRIYSSRARAQELLTGARTFPQESLKVQSVLLSAAADLLQADLSVGFATTRWKGIAQCFANAGMERVRSHIYSTVFGKPVFTVGDNPIIVMHPDISNIESAIINLLDKKAATSYTTCK